MWLARDEDSVTTGPHTLQRSVCKDSGRAALWPTLLVSECRRDRGGGTREVGTRQAGRQADRQADQQVDWQAGPAGGDGQAESCHLGRFSVLSGCSPQGSGFRGRSRAPCRPPSTVNSLAVLTGATGNASPAASCRGTWKVQAGFVVCERHTHRARVRGSPCVGTPVSEPQATSAPSTPPCRPAGLQSGCAEARLWDFGEETTAAMPVLMVINNHN